MPKRKRRTGHETIRASITLALGLYARWGACAALNGVDRSTFATQALEAACQGFFMIDKRVKPADRVKLSHRPESEPPVSPDADDAA